MENAYAIHDLMEDKVLRNTFPNKESAKEKRDERNIEYYGKEFYDKLTKSKETPRYIVIRTSSHPAGASSLPQKSLNPVKAPNNNKNKNTKEAREKILNKNKPKSKSEKRKAKK